MTNNAIQIKVKQRLNKLDSRDYDNIECWQIMEAVNKAQIEWARRQCHGNNQKREGDESTKMLIDDLQPILVEVPLTTTVADKYHETEVIPDNYFYFKRISATSTTECCTSGRSLVIYLAQAANVDELLVDVFKKPSAEWCETFATAQSNRFRIYTNNDFDVTNVMLTYYRQPREIRFEGCVDINTGLPIAVDVECEFKDDVVEMIIDEAVSILAGDVELFNQFSRNKQNATLTN